VKLTSVSPDSDIVGLTPPIATDKELSTLNLVDASLDIAVLRSPSATDLLETSVEIAPNNKSSLLNLVDASVEIEVEREGIRLVVPERVVPVKNNKSPSNKLPVMFSVSPLTATIAVDRDSSALILSEASVEMVSEITVDNDSSDRDMLVEIAVERESFPIEMFVDTSVDSDSKLDDMFVDITVLSESLLFDMFVDITVLSESLLFDMF
jgi:hypothetical protein